MKHKTFRIIEVRETFYIEVRDGRKGLFLHKKVWKKLNEIGTVNRYGRPYIPPIKFTSLQEARNYLNKTKAQIIIHQA